MKRTTKGTRVAVIIPAYNEECRIAAVLDTVMQVPGIHAVIVVSDGSTDATVPVASQYPIRVEALPINRGKGGAMLHGARCASDCDVLVFLDADLIGLRPEHIANLYEPVAAGRAQMALGRFIEGRGLTDLAQRLVTCISGQRAIRREIFLAIPDLDRVGYGIEMAITFYVRARKMAEEWVTMRGVTHPMKEEKLGWLPGFVSRMGMYYQMGRFWASYHFRGRPPAKALTLPPPPPPSDLPILMTHQEQRQEIIGNRRGQDDAVDPVEHAAVARQ